MNPKIRKRRSVIRNDFAYATRHAKKYHAKKMAPAVEKQHAAAHFERTLRSDFDLQRPPLGQRDRRAAKSTRTGTLVVAYDLDRAVA